MTQYQVHVTCGNNILIMEYRNEPKISEIRDNWKSGYALLYKKEPQCPKSCYDFKLKLVAKIII